MSTPDDLTKLGVRPAAREIANGRISSVDLTRALLDRIQSRDPEIGAWAYLDPESALKQARAADEISAKGRTVGPLHGVPIAIKDIIDTADMPTQNGCPIFADRQPAADAQCVSALKRAGAVILGKTVTTELALLTPSKTKNPVNKAHTPGGSSAGSAAAVADGMVAGALGTQTAGSVLRPASYCGTVGFKPTFGLIPRNGVLMQSHTLDTVGVLTRTIEDAALMTQVLGEHDPADATSISMDLTGIVETATTPPSGAPKFAFLKTPVWNEADAELHTVFKGLTDSLAGNCETIDIEIFSDIIEWHRIVHSAENAAYYGPLLDQWPEHISPGLTQRIKHGRTEAVVDYVNAIINRVRAHDAVANVLDRYDAIITPAAPGPAPEGLSSTGSPIFNGSWTYLGVPALSIPLLSGAGMPIGVQLVGKSGADARLLQAGTWLEKHLS